MADIDAENEGWATSFSEELEEFAKEIESPERLAETEKERKDQKRSGLPDLAWNVLVRAHRSEDGKLPITYADLVPHCEDLSLMGLGVYHARPAKSGVTAYFEINDKGRRIAKGEF